MPHLIFPSLTSQSKQFSIEGPEAHHWIRVLRVQPGDILNINNGAGLRAKGEVLTVDLSIPRAEGKILEIIPADQRTYRLHLLQGLPRGSKFDFVLEKATELGVDSISAFFSEKNPVELDIDQQQKKKKRWESVVTAAVKQSGSAITPLVKPVLPFDQLVASCRETFSLLLEPHQENQSLKKLIQAKIPSVDINIVVGPESGFSRKEVERLIEVGCHPIVLGSRILRTETAGLSVISILNYELELF